MVMSREAMGGGGLVPVIQVKMAKNLGPPEYAEQSHPFLAEPPPAYSPRTPPPPQRSNIPPAAIYIPPSSPQYPVPGTLGGALSAVGKEVSGVLKGLTIKGVKAIYKAVEHPTADCMKSGNVVQLVSRSTGQSLQILQSPSGSLVLDGLGGEGHQYINAHFTVVQDNDNYTMLHNNFNYLAIKDGITQLYSAGPSGVALPSCRFKAREVLLQKQFLTLDSMAERGRYLAVLPNGQIKSSLTTTATDNDTHFALRMIYSPYGPQTSQKKK